MWTVVWFHFSTEIHTKISKHVLLLVIFGFDSGPLDCCRCWCSQKLELNKARAVVAVKVRTHSTISVFLLWYQKNMNINQYVHVFSSFKYCYSESRLDDPRPNLVGGIPTPQKNMTSSVGICLFPTEWNVIKFMFQTFPNHQPDTLW